jgi:TolB-like protein/tRNA A-37 threonylcarbamoyl transferase component Bud32
MDDQRWKQIEGVYLAALEAPDRTALLREACQDDPDLLIAVELLLQEEPSTVSLFGRLTLSSLDKDAGSPIRALLAPDAELGLYRIVELLGSGGSSDVYKAYDTRLDRHVALKVFDGTRVTEEFRSRFARESRVAASLNHPNIATVYEVGEADGFWFIAMEFIDGVTLRAAFADPTSSLRQRLEHLAQAASGLARAHANGIAHCDLKPENMMVTRDGLVKVLDFGLARLTGSRDATGPRFEGTIGYMSPEQVAGGSINASSDVFSFGCILYEAATGSLPFPPAPRWIDSLMHARAPRIETTSEVRAGLADLVDDCLVKDAAERLPSLEDVSRRLQLILEHGSSRVGLWVVAMVALASLALSAVAYWQWPTAAPAGSVAVIPFVTTEATPDGRRLADGLSEGVIHALTLLPDLKVIASSSSFRFAGDSLDISDVARTLGVQTLVTGRLVMANGQLRISAELVRGSDGTVMWAADFTQSLQNVVEVESRIALEIARRVRSELTAADQRRLNKAVHPNAEAYSLLLRGRYEMSLYTPESGQRAASYFEQALGIDPSYALANAELANAYRFLATSGNLKPAEALQRGEQAALRAVAMDDELPEAHAALAGIRRDRWQWADAEREYRRAIALSSSFGPARQALAIALTLTRNDESAVAEITRARELDPVGLPGAVESAAVFYNLRLYDRARATLEDAANLDGLAAVLWRWNGIVSGGKGDFVTAVAAFEKAIELGDTSTATRCYYVHALARAGRRADALRDLRALERESTVVAPSFLAIAYLGMGDRERAMAQLQAGYAARDPLLQYIVVESYLDALMDDPRFKEIVDGMGLPQPRRS